MSVKIIRGSRQHCLDGLRDDVFDLSEYPLRTYTDHNTFVIEDGELRVIQGVNPVPQDRFLVPLGTPAARLAGSVLPGIVPFLVSTIQASARRRIADPQPTDVGLPLLTTENAYLIKWLLGLPEPGSGVPGQWRRLSQDEILQLPECARPDPSVDPDARSAASYQTVSAAVAAPEAVEFVLPRAHGLPHEPWLARSPELACSWRLVVPNTSISCRPVAVPPGLCVIGQNFNVLAGAAPEILLAAGILLSREHVLEFLVGISPWSQGDTPRPRTKHINATLWMFKSELEEIIRDHRETLRNLGVDLRIVWQLHLAAATHFARGASETGVCLREMYTEISPRKGMAAVPTAVLDRTGRWLHLGSREGDIRLRFRTPTQAALAAAFAWSLIPQELSIADIFAVRFPDGLLTFDDQAVNRILFTKIWSQLVVGS